MLSVKKRISKLINYIQNDSHISNIIIDLSNNKLRCCQAQDKIEKYNDLQLFCWEISHFTSGMKGIDCFFNCKKSEFNQAGFIFFEKKIE